MRLFVVVVVVCGISVLWKNFSHWLLKSLSSIAISCSLIQQQKQHTFFSLAHSFCYRFSIIVLLVEFMVLYYCVYAIWFINDVDLIGVYICDISMTKSYRDFVLWPYLSYKMNFESNNRANMVMSSSWLSYNVPTDAQCVIKSSFR